MNDEQETLVNLLRKAVDLVYSEKRFLLRHSDGDREGLEQAFAFRVGVYLTRLLEGTEYEALDVDSEYNKSYGNPKRTKNFPRGVRPDIILHLRNSNDSNKLVVEFKGYWDKDIEHDILKLIDLTHPEDSYQYSIGVLVILGKTEATLRHVIGGQVL